MFTIFSRHQYLVWEYYKMYFPKFSGAKSSSHLSVAALEEGDALEHVGGGGGGLLLLLLLLHACHHLLHQSQSWLCLFVCCLCWNSKLGSLHHSLPAIEAANFHLKYEIFVEIQSKITRNLKKWGTWPQNLQTLCDHSTLSEIGVGHCFHVYHRLFQRNHWREFLPFHHSPIFPTYRHYWFHNGWMQWLSDWICTFSRSGWICTFSHTNLQTGWISHQNLHLWNQIQHWLYLSPNVHGRMATGQLVIFLLEWNYFAISCHYNLSRCSRRRFIISWHNVHYSLSPPITVLRYSDPPGFYCSSAGCQSFLPSKWVWLLARETLSYILQNL